MLACTRGIVGYRYIGVDHELSAYLGVGVDHEFAGVDSDMARAFLLRGCSRRGTISESFQQ